MVNEEGVHSLLIAPATFADSGTYSCVARNKVGEASFSVELKVVGMLKWIKIKSFRCVIYNIYIIKLL